MRRRTSMLRYAGRRLLLALPTLLGIFIVTFAFVHLAPGDPLDAGSELSAAGGGGRASDAVRRLYFLDLPVLFNPNPRGVEGRVARLLEAQRQRRADADDPRAREAWQRCGTVCLKTLNSRFPESDVDERPRLLAAVDAIRRRHPHLCPAEEDPGSWLVRVLPLLDEKQLAPLVARLGRDDRIVAELVARGTAVLPLLMPIVQDGEGPSAMAADLAASQITGRAPASSADRLDPRRRQQDWREWWYQERRNHVTFGPVEQLLGHVTQTRFGRWLGRLFTLRLGASVHDGRPVADKLSEALPVTLLLSGLSLLLSYLLGIPLGIHAAVRRGRVEERLTTGLLFLLYSLPSFWIAMLLILLLGGVGVLDVFPIYGLASSGLEQATGLAWLHDRLMHLVLPVFCLTCGSLAALSRYQRAAMLDVLGQEYIRTARAKGLTEGRVIFRHALPNALLPTVTLLGLQLPHLIGGSVIIERIFNIPGMGLLTFQAFLGRDYPVIMAVSVLAAVVTLLGLLLSDIAYAWLDPRIRVGGRS